MSGIFGWCLTNQHDQCRERYKRFWFEKHKRKEILVFAEEETVCDCTCHTAENVVDSDKKSKTAPKARRKK